MVKETLYKTTTFKKATIRYFEKGKGRTVVLLHGFLESAEIWEDFSEVLAKKFRVVAIDLPGHGESECLGYIHSMDLMAECVFAVLKHLRIRKSVLIGHSMGGYVAVAYAEMYPNNTKGLGLFHSTAAADNELKKKDRDKMISLVKKSKKDITKDIIPKLFAPSNLNKYKKEVQRLKAIAKRTPKQGILAAIEGMKTRREREIILRFAPYPILFIIGKNDPVLDFEKLMEQAALPRDVQTLILEKAGHMGFIEEKRKTLEAVSSFTKVCFSKS